MVTIYDVAKRAGVSAMTVSRVINQSSAIKPETRRRVEAAIEELDYIPNRSARSLISKDTKLVSLIITDISNPFFTNIARGAEDKANETGYQVVFSNSDENIDKESDYIRSAVSRRIDGVLIVPTGDSSAGNIQLLQNWSIPFVLIDRAIDGVSADLVMADNRAATSELIRYLLGKGHSRIALLAGPASISNSREREAAYRESLAAASIVLKEEWIQRTSLKQRNTNSLMSRLLSLPEGARPSAIVATNNFLAVEAVKALREQGIRVPSDITVVCFDDPEPIPDFNPFLTVIAQPAYDYGYLGMQLLIDRMEGKYLDGPRLLKLSSRLEVRLT